MFSRIFILGLLLISLNSANSTKKVLGIFEDRNNGVWGQKYKFTKEAEIYKVYITGWNGSSYEVVEMKLSPLGGNQYKVKNDPNKQVFKISGSTLYCYDIDLGWNIVGKK
jgi:hypothetical protein